MTTEKVITAQCPHGYTFSLPLVTIDLNAVTRELLLACPRCSFDARGFLHKP